MKKAENVAAVNRGKEGDSAAGAVAAMIRQSSKGGQLITEAEILGRLADQHLSSSPAEAQAGETGPILKKLVEETGDLKELTGQDGVRRYYSSDFMTEAYARILLQKKGDRLCLIAETVRENSALYPRPVPLDLFTKPPFELTQQEVLNDLERMGSEEEYRDIVSTRTSTSRVFLYSTLHLEPDHASMLAEWLDVGQSNNP
jgi:hypothetical protein